MAIVSQSLARAKARVPLRRRGPAVVGGAESPAPPTTYSAREAAAVLGVSADTVERHYLDVGGFHVGRRLRFARRIVDRLAREGAGAATLVGTASEVA